MPVFEDLAFIYDQAIDWKQRLAREIPFLINLVKYKPNARILDLACGSGRHAAMLASQGYDVTGLDLSPQMIEAAQYHAKETGVSVHFLVADMRQTKEIVEGQFDLIICLGNSLALLPDLSDLQQTVSNVYQLLTKGGNFVSQVLNFQEIRQTGFRYFPMKSGQTKDGNEVIFVRFFEPLIDERSTRLIFLGIIKSKSDWQTKLSSHQVLQLDKPILESTLRNAGLSEMTFYQDYDKTPFNKQKSRNLITLGTKKP